MVETTQWEYRIQTAGSTFNQPKDEEIEAMLNEWGEEGWEVVAVHNLESTNKVRIIAKRTLPGSIKRSRTWP
jgi:hypothetical protein